MGPQDELLECFDEQGNMLAPRPRREVCQPWSGYYEWHAVANIWLVDKDCRILCTKRSEKLIGSPGKWQSYLGGHVKAGMDFKRTAVDEAAEEAGVSISPNDLYLINKGRYEPRKHFYESYVYLFNGRLEDLKFNDGEVTEAKWMTFEEYNRDHDAHPENWCNGCSLESQEKIREWLKQNRN